VCADRRSPGIDFNAESLVLVTGPTHLECNRVRKNQDFLACWLLAIMSSPLVDQGGQPVNIATNTHPTTQATSTTLLVTITAIMAFYLTFRTLASQTTSDEFLQKWQIKKNVGLDTANKTISALFGASSAIIGAYVLASYGGSYYTDVVITYFMPVAIGYFIYDFFAMIEVYKLRLDETDQNANETDKTIRGFISNQPLISIHHLALSLFFIPLMVNRRDHYPGDPMLACALLMEASTPFVSLRAILYNLHLRHSVIYVLNGIVMVFVFFWCRIGIYPWFYHVHSLATQVTFIEAVMKTPPRCATWLILALLLQLHWFRIMFLGALKVVREKFRQTPATDSTILQSNVADASDKTNIKTPNNNHAISTEFVAKDIMKNHKSD